MALLKIATWNVNGIRAREAQVLEWVERERPDVICLQELKSTVAQVPAALCELQGYRCYWHGARAYSGVGLHIRRDAFAEEPLFSHPAFDFETRIVTAQIGDLIFISVYVPNGGKDFAAKMEFLRQMETFIGEAHAGGMRVVLCGDINIARSRTRRSPERAQSRFSRSATGRKRIIRTHPGARTRRCRPRAGPGQRQSFHLVGALAQVARAQYRLATRLRPRERIVGVQGHAVRCLSRGGTSDHAPVVARVRSRRGANQIEQKRNLRTAFTEDCCCS